MKRTMMVALMVVAMLAGVLAYAWAAPQVTVNATAGTKLELNIPATTWNVGTLAPGDPAATMTYDVQVKSNKGYSIATSYNKGTLPADSTLTGDLVTGAKGRSPVDGSFASNLDHLSMTMGWGGDAGTPYASSVEYTVTN